MSEAEQVAEQSVEEAPVAVQSGGWVDTEGKFVEGFREKLPDGLGEHSFLDKFGSVPDLIKWGVNADKLIGKKTEELWTSEEPELMEKRREIMGIPKEASEYAYDPVEMPEEIPQELIDSRIEAMKQHAKENGWSKAQAKNAIEWDLKNTIEQFNDLNEQQARQTKIAEDTLRQDWKGDKYEYNVAKVGEALDYLGLSQFKDNPAIANDPSIVKAVFEKLVPLIDNDTLVESKQSQNPATMEDRLRQLEDDMMNYDGRRTDHKYASWMKEREGILERFSS